MSKLIGDISKNLLIPPNNLMRLINSAPSRYKEYQIPKRKRGEWRTIAQPAKEIKSIQYWVIDNVLSKFPIHSAAMAYVAGGGIKHNAAAHVEGRDILKMDFENFFPSIVPEDFVYTHNRQRKRVLENDDLSLAINILYWRPKGSSDLRLSIGAPSSPVFSNAVMFEFDQTVWKETKELEVRYTRYADDLTFSGPDFATYITQRISSKKTIEELDRPNIRINHGKTVYVSRKYKRFVTGMVLTNDGKISIDRNRKRELRATVHRFILDKLNKEETLKLHGYLAFVNDVDPEFLERLEQKYGEGLFDKLKEIHRQQQA